MLLDSMKAKMRSLSQAKEEELALDMKILDHVLQESKEDTEGQKQRKVKASDLFRLPAKAAMLCRSSTPVHLGSSKANMSCIILC